MISACKGDKEIMKTKNDARGKLGARVACLRLSFCVAVAAIIACVAAAPRPAVAQAIVASINGDPITNIDIDERMKMLRVLHKPATREAAIESLFTDRIKIQRITQIRRRPQG